MSKILRYPLQRIEGISDYLKINVVEYEAPGINKPNLGLFQLPTGSQVNGPGSNQRILGTILLPIPQGLNDTNIANWAGSNMNSLEGAGVKSLQDIVKNLDFDDVMTDPGKAFEATGKTLKGVSKNALQGLDSNTRKILSDAAIGGAVNVFGGNVSASDLTSRSTGVVLNPNLELLFKGVDLRNFTFTFDLTPRSRAESNQIKAIINTFKKRMAPKTTVKNSSSGSKGIFIQSPEVFNMEFRRGGSKHPFLFSMKTCALTNIQVDYAGTGAYTTYEDSTPVKMTMSLSFRELNPIYAEDYNNDLENGVGF